MWFRHLCGAVRRCRVGSYGREAALYHHGPGSGSREWDRGPAHGPRNHRVGRRSDRGHGGAALDGRGRRRQARRVDRIRRRRFEISTVQVAHQNRQSTGASWPRGPLRPIEAAHPYRRQPAATPRFGKSPTFAIVFYRIRLGSKFT